jgi:hypothetical protein
MVFLIENFLVVFLTGPPEWGKKGAGARLGAVG